MTTPPTTPHRESLNQPTRNLRIDIYVQHLLGAGHLVRMRALAACLARGGHRVTLISGGVGGDDAARAYDFFQLPPVRTTTDFAALLQHDGRPVSDAFKARRASALLARVRADAPQVLVVETFPFGRRALRFELTPLMEAASALSPRPLRLCSVRDILQQRAPARYRQSVDEVNAWFDFVLVHADPTVTTLGESFPLADELNDKIFYSGYVHGDGDGVDNGDDGHDEVIVSAGGGAVGVKLLQTALAASTLNDRRWRLLVGGNLDDAAFASLQNRAGDGVVVERNRADFVSMLSRCAVSVSQAGYNTVLDVVRANCRAVLVPFAAHGESEQTQRAKIFSNRGRAVVLAEKDLTATRLAAVVERAARLDASKCSPVNMDGAAATTRFIENYFL